jgi:lysophospholipase L1-like esterase
MQEHDTDARHLPRREFLGSTLAAAGGMAGIGLSGCASSGSSSAAALTSGTREPIVSPGDVVLFQGDSITDAGRSREHADQPNAQAGLGTGYAWLAASGLLVARADARLEIYNRGISGNKVHQLAERWDAEALVLAPDVLSILIGVNDIWHSKSGDYDGTVEVYERDYHALLERTRAALPEVELVVCEPFVLRCGAVDDTWFPEFDTYRAAARRVSDTHGATWVGFQAMFDQAVRYAPPEHWAGDGVHPSAAGAALMAQTWLRTVAS